MSSWFKARSFSLSNGFFVTAAAAVCALMTAPFASAWAETYPERPIQMVIPAGPGSSTDTIMRSLAKFAAPLLGQPIVIFNKPGASGTIGVGSVTRASNDGYTIGGVWSGPITMAPHVATPSYTPADYQIVAMTTEAPGVLCVQPGFPAKNAGEFLAELRNNPDKYTYGSDGVGGFVQFATGRIFEAAGVRQRIIPYSGADQTVTAFISGTIDIYGGAIATILPFVTEGKAKCLLVTSSRRYAALPDVQSLADVNLAQAQTLLWRGIIAPRDVPADRLEKLRAVFSDATMNPEFKTIAERRGEEIWNISPDDAAKYVRDEYAQMERLAKQLQLRQN
ncbi:MAG TPA: tripartite tricarboxylate transporter substrate binding protein [Bradyrhizobium sp.]|jgi:tripartite-type tricarboxylate transporter receptor subunit TctC|nr:tripartite tricarboxylate transporter substrate binding protein [Bradyrhizobium sp.]